MQNCTIARLNKKAFTLAEVLITLSIIGVVAVLVIPLLTSNTNEAELKTAWKKTYGTIANATNKIIYENGGDLVGAFSSNVDMQNKYVQYLTTIKTCAPGAAAGECWLANGVAKEADGDSWDISAGDPAVVLADGTFVKFSVFATNCDSVVGSLLRCGTIVADVNGNRGPNVWGKDIFFAFIQKNGIKPYGVPEAGQPSCGNPLASGSECSMDALLN